MSVSLGSVAAASSTSHEHPAPETPVRDLGQERFKALQDKCLINRDRCLLNLCHLQLEENNVDSAVSGANEIISYVYDKSVRYEAQTAVSYRLLTSGQEDAAVARMNTIDDIRARDHHFLGLITRTLEQTKATDTETAYKIIDHITAEPKKEEARGSIAISLVLHRKSWEQALAITLGLSDKNQRNSLLFGHVVMLHRARRIDQAKEAVAHMDKDHNDYKVLQSSRTLAELFE